MDKIPYRGSTTAWYFRTIYRLELYAQRPLCCYKLCCYKSLNSCNLLSVYNLKKLLHLFKHSRRSETCKCLTTGKLPKLAEECFKRKKQSDGPGYYQVPPQKNAKTRSKDEIRITTQGIYFLNFSEQV